MLLPYTLVGSMEVVPGACTFQKELTHRLSVLAASPETLAKNLEATTPQPYRPKKHQKELVKSVCNDIQEKS